MKSNLYNKYGQTRFSFNRQRSLIWKEIVRYLQKRYINPDKNILELGSGYCDFINNVRAKKKYALDKYINPKEYALKDVIPLFGDSSKLRKIKDNSIGIVFASNFFEHLKDDELEDYIKIIKKKLQKNGLLIIIQPNFKLCAKNYFDDYTHTKAWSDISLTDYLVARDFRILLSKPRFLPFSMKSRMPKNRILVRLYLHSPIKPFAGQMLIIAYNQKNL